MGAIITEMGHVALRVRNLDEAMAHATEILGLRVVERENGNAFLSCGARHHDLQLIESDKLALDHISFEASGSQALDQLSSILARRGVKVFSDRPQELGLGQALRFAAPGGFSFEVYAQMERVDPSFKGPGVRPRKYGHTTLRVESVAEMEDFLSRVLGFIPSDRVGDTFLWMRCNTDHHGVAMLGAPPVGLHHYAWEVENWSFLKQLGDHLLAHGKRFIYGPGRHGPGRNLFCYHLDGAGACCEYTADVQRIEDENWHGADWANEPYWVNQWGPNAPEEFLGLCVPVATKAEVVR